MHLSAFGRFTELAQTSRLLENAAQEEPPMKARTLGAVPNEPVGEVRS